MKKNIHPEYHKDAKITCACGNVIKVGSTAQKSEIEICSACHPFYTVKKKTLDTTGRVERFKKMAEKAAQKKKVLKNNSKTEKKKKVRAKKKDK